MQSAGAANGGKPWLASEITRLRALWIDPAWSTEAIAAEFGRTKKACASQAHYALGVKRPVSTYTNLWPAHLDQLASSMWKRGQSSGAIAIATGKTRSAVMGKVTRLGLVKSHPHTDCRRKSLTSTERARRYRAKQSARKTPPRMAGASVPVSARCAPDAPPPLNLSFNENTGCMWPTSEKGFCGHPKHQRKSYCEAHCRA